MWSCWFLFLATITGPDCRYLAQLWESVQMSHFVFYWGSNCYICSIKSTAVKVIEHQLHRYIFFTFPTLQNCKSINHGNIKYGVPIKIKEILWLRYALVRRCKHDTMTLHHPRQCTWSPGHHLCSAQCPPPTWSAHVIHSYQPVHVTEIQSQCYRIFCLLFIGWRHIAGSQMKQCTIQNREVLGHFSS